MKNIITTLYLCLCWIYVQAQPDYAWAKNIGGSNHDYGIAIAIDRWGYVYVSGYYRGTADFDPDPSVASLTSIGETDVFIAKYDARGNYIWAKSIGGDDVDLNWGLAVDLSGNIYVTGGFQSLNFNPGTGMGILTALGGRNMYIVKYDTDGNAIWAKNVGSGSHVSNVTGGEGNAITADAWGNLYVTGGFNGSGDFDPGTAVFNLTSSGGNDIFLAGYDTVGNYRWAISVGGNNNDEGCGVAVAASGHVYVTGRFNGATDFNPGSAVDMLTSGGNNNYSAFLAKYDTNGNYVWALNPVGSGSLDYSSGVVVDAGDNVCITGQLSGPADFDPGSGVATVNAPGGQDAFLAKYDANGNYLWAGNISNSAGGDRGSSIAVDPLGNIYVAGNYNGTSDFNPGLGVDTLTHAGSGDAFIAKYDAGGNYVWVQSLGGATGTEWARGIVIDPLSVSVYVTGYFRDSARFNPGTAILVGAGGSDAFILKLGQGCDVFTNFIQSDCDSFSFNGITYTTSGVYMDTFVNSLNCDSIVILNLTIGYTNQNPVIKGAFCDSATFNGTTYTRTGIYVQPYTNISGCDSNIILDLTIYPSDYSSNTELIYTPCFAASYQLEPLNTGISTYQWDDNSTHNFRVVNSPGLYWVTYEKAGCIVQTDSFLVYFNIPELHVDNSCNGQPTGKARIAQQNTDTNTYAYTWYNAAQHVISTIDSVINQPSGNYSVHIRNYSGCDTIVHFTIEADYYQVSFTVDSTACEDALIPFLNTSDNYFTSFQWNFGDGSFSNELHPEHRYDSVGIYEIMLAGTAGVCTDTLYKKIIIDTRHQVQFATDKYTICTGEAIKFTPHSADSTLITYNWQLGNSNSFTTTSNTAVVHAYDEPGIYPVTLTAKFRACPDTSFADTVKVHPIPLVHLGPDSIICLKGTAVTLQNHHPDIEGYSYLWSTGATTQSIAVIHQGYYSLTVTNENGCAATQQVRVDKDCYGNIPNVFTPNGDGVNDYFYPRQLVSRGVISFRMEVFSRWGKKVFETFHTDGRGWDGKFGGKEQPDGVYVYVIEVQLDNGSQERYEGNVTLIR